ncbi:hypothetical protein [Mycobacterium marseillense]|uniref:hypothetical protein n=1 Tax=Mycobacterium marseillense TaxID=701042 RepID=UPI0012FE3FCE|nr:hypothetical protein [Mycobacterium marseillense]
MTVKGELLTPSISRHREWETDSDDLVKVMRALVPILVTSAKSTDSIKKTRSSYSIYTATSNLTDQTDLVDAVNRSPEAVEAVYYYHRSKISLRLPYYSLRLYVRKPWNSDNAVVTATIDGPDNNETAGLIENTFNRIDGEINRQRAAEWNADPIPISGQSPEPGQAAAPPKRWRIITHPVIAGIIATVVGGVILALALAVLHMGQVGGDRPEVPTKQTNNTTSPSSGTSETLPSAPGSTSPGGPRVTGTR